jgi:predicted membrane protein DUF2231
LFAGIRRYQANKRPFEAQGGSVMESKVKLLGHPIHPMLIVFPLGLLGMSVFFDIIRLITGNEALATVTYWDIAAGIVLGLVAAVFGLLDWPASPPGSVPNPAPTDHAAAPPAPRHARGSPHLGRSPAHSQSAGG